MTAEVVTFPMDTAKTRLQLQETHNTPTMLPICILTVTELGEQILDTCAFQEVCLWPRNQKSLLHIQPDIRYRYLAS